MRPVRRLRRVLLVPALVAALAVPAGAQVTSPNPGSIPATTYLAMFDDADLRGVTALEAPVFDALFTVTGDPGVDARIRAAAEARGYRPRPVASVELVVVDGRRLQPAAAEAWRAMRTAAAAEGVTLRLVSAFRDAARQAALFRERLGGSTSDAAIDEVLRRAAPPGYSKHHTGYAVDVGGIGGAGFASTPAYRWLAADDFANARRHGWVPSFPVGGEGMGPDPESWEFVWVGGGRIGCVTDGDAGDPFCDTIGGPHDVDVAWLRSLGVTVGCAPGRYCVDDPITRGEAASLLWRLHGAPPVAGHAPFVDVRADDHFAPAVAWLWAEGMVTGTSAETFSPDELLEGGQALALVLRLGARDDLPAPVGMTPAPAPMVPPAPTDPGPQITRGEFASILRGVTAGR